MKKILLFLSLSFMMAGCHTKNENNKAEGPQDVNPTSDTFMAANNNATGDTLIVNDDDFINLSEMPSTAKRMDNHFQYAVYTNEERVLEDYDDAIVYSVWLADERTETVCKIFETNPKAEAQWEKMQGDNSNGVAVGLDQIVSAEKAWIAPGDVSKIIVEGCPDGRNEWTYIIDTNKKTATQLPSNEGVASLDWEKKEIIVSSYGYYSEGGRYTFMRAYDNNGKFLRMVGGKNSYE